MNWVYRFDDRALKELKKLGRQAQRDIIAYLDERVSGDSDPRRFGKGLKADLAGLWRYRVGDYRILCQIKDGELLVLVVAESRVARSGSPSCRRDRRVADSVGTVCNGRGLRRVAVGSLMAAKGFSRLAWLTKQRFFKPLPTHAFCHHWR